MSELVIDFITSLDGYASAEGWPGWWGLEGPEYLAWLGERPERDYTLLMGANTYRLMYSFVADPESSNPNATAEEDAATSGLTSLPKVVFSSTLEAPLPWANTLLVTEDAVEAVAAMKRDGTSMSTIGSLSLCRSLLKAGLVDRYRVVVFPVITGSTGRERIYDSYPDVALDMVDSRTFDGRIQLLEYVPTLLQEIPVTITESTTHTIQAPGATLTYDVRRNDDSTEPILFLIGSPMGAAGFVTLASHFPDRAVATYDPRGAERSPKDDPTTESTPDQHADDLHRVIDALGGGPVDLFASSGGAVNALVLVARHPEDVRLLVAHEPPAATVLPDAENAKAASRAIHETYERSGWGAGMAHFIAVVSHRGPFPDDFATQPPPDPAMFGMPADDNGDRTDVMLGQNMITCTHYQHDFDALRKASTRIVLAAGVGSEGEMANRGAHAVAERLGTSAVTFPSDHGGFLGGEYGQTGDPDAFAAKLREVLATPA